jgi:hypothetical protein
VSNLESDLYDHFTIRLHRLLGDNADTMERADIPIERAATLLLTALLSEAITGAFSLGMDETGFVELAGQFYCQMAPSLKKRRTNLNRLRARARKAANRVG